MATPTREKEVVLKGLASRKKQEESPVPDGHLIDLLKGDVDLFEHFREADNGPLENRKTE